jgi:hypothetical protein
MSDYVVIDSKCPDWTLWQQYQTSEPVKNYFTWFKSYLQEKYFDAIESSYMPALGIYNNTTEFLEYFSKYFIGVLRPLDIIGTTRWDSGYDWDNNNEWDKLEIAGKIPISIFRKLIFCVIDWSYHDWSLIYLFKVVHDFTGEDFNNINIVQSSVNLDLFTITLPSTNTSLLFKSLVENYKDIWGFPYNISFTITLT